VDSSFSDVQIDEMKNLVRANFLTRDLVNEPLIYLTATKMAEEIMGFGKEAGFHVEVFHKAKIESLGMNGLLAVNRGSVDPPTFSVIEYKPENARNTQPIVLVGKGVVYDTGGLSLKPTPNSMDFMKCDMGGAATVIGTLFALAKNNLPVYAVGLIPATDNRPGGNAITPGDVIEMMNGKSVEIKNTDAEGRLIMADALVYAKRYQPDLVIDLATLTGSAARAIGSEGMVMMGTASAEMKNSLIETGEEVYERLVEFPLWEEYGDQLKSDIADISNLGGATAGAITAGKFLEHFTESPWIHLDIAGTAYFHKPSQYRGKNGTGIGVRLLYNFIKKNY
ncbi:MAG: M17 family metallopeptidase, partial [Bacteroidota bacterium]